MILYQLLPLLALGAPLVKTNTFNSSLNPWASRYGQSAAPINTHLTSSWSERRKAHLEMRAGMNRLWNAGKKEQILSTRRPGLGAEIAQREAMAARSKQATNSFIMPHMRPRLNQVRADGEL